MRTIVIRLLAVLTVFISACTGDKATAPDVVGSISISNATTSLQYGQTVQFTALVRSSSGNALSGRTVTWSSSNDTVATVSSSGVVTAGAVRGGTAETVTITATSEGKSAITSLTIAPIPVATVIPSLAQLAIYVGQSVQMGATAKDVTGASVTGRAITWSSATPTVANVTAQGLVTALAPGSTTITSSAEGKTASSVVTVALVPVERVSIAPSNASLYVEQTLQLSASAKDSAGNPITGRTVTWASSATAVATVSATGLVSALVSGTAVITASVEGKSATVNVTVAQVPVSTVTVSPTSGSLYVGQTLQLTASAKDSAGNALTARAVTWSTATPNVVTVSGTGLVTAKALGTATISATVEGKTGTTTLLSEESSPVLRIDPWIHSPDYLRVEQSQVPLRGGVTYTFSARVYGNVRLTGVDHFPFLRGNWSENGIIFEQRANDHIYVTQGRWTLVTATLRPPKDAGFDISLARYSDAPIIITDIKLTSGDGKNLLRNGDLKKGLARWVISHGTRWFPTLEEALLASELTPVKNPTGLVSKNHCLSRRPSGWVVPKQIDGMNVQYTGMSSVTENLQAFEDSLVTLFIPSDPKVSESEVREILCRLNTSWAFYRDITGRVPPPVAPKIGFGGEEILYARASLAVADKGFICGAGCGYVGAAGLIIGQDAWRQTVEMYRDGTESRMLFEYEMGRNFWFYSFKNEHKAFHGAVAFATVMGHLAGVAAGSPAMAGLENFDWIQLHRKSFTWYLTDPDFDDFRQGGMLGHFLQGGLLIHLNETYPDFLRRFYRSVAEQPVAQNLDQAIRNYVTAASYGAGRDLTSWFRTQLKWPI